MRVMLLEDMNLRCSFELLLFCYLQFVVFRAADPRIFNVLNHIFLHLRHFAIDFDKTFVTA